MAMAELAINQRFQKLFGQLLSEDKRLGRIAQHVTDQDIDEALARFEEERDRNMLIMYEQGMSVAEIAEKTPRASGKPGKLTVPYIQSRLSWNLELWADYLVEVVKARRQRERMLMRQSPFERQVRCPSCGSLLEINFKIVPKPGPLS